MIQIPYNNNSSSFNFSNKRINHFIIFDIVFSFFLFFLCHVIFSHDILVGIFSMPMVFSPIFCLDPSFRFSTQWGLFALTFAQAAFSGFQPSRLFFSFSNVVFLEPIYVDWAKHLFSIQICNSCSASNMVFLIKKGLDHIFHLGSKVSSLSTFRTRSPSLKFLGFTFLLNALAILFW